MTMRVIEASPEDKLFNYTPDEKLCPFAEMVKKIANIENGYMKGIPLDKWEYKDEFEGVATKEDLIKIRHEIREETRKSGKK
ncbi:hypothetical protein [Fictibacillus barbaricus]|uniref:hypothetical protein n=1 Tax=Fictibacillus barbaricus TaxID=182136 RepID=UPI001F099307|nr:hypothetical protein [Fictibacillus barbaricus]